jgi:hypothetical protein
MLDIKMSLQNVYGNWLFYPECKASKTFADIAKTKTLSKEILRSLEAIGYQIEIVNNSKLKDLLK